MTSWAGLIPYTADAQGSALLLCVSADGSEWEAFLGPHDGGEEARLQAAVAALCVGTQGLLAPAGCRAEEAAAHLLSKLQAGKGVHRLATSSDEGVLFLTPTRRVTPPAASRLEWVPAVELLAALDGTDAARGWSAELRQALCVPTGRQALQHVVQIRTGPARWATLSTDPDETPMDASVPRRVASNLFLGDLPACRNTPLLGMLAISRVLLLLPDEEEAEVGGGGDSSGAAAQLEAAAAETAEAVGAELAVVRGAAAALRGGEASALLLEACGWMAPAVEDGGLLVAGRLDGRISPAWLVAAFLGGTQAGAQSVARAFGQCRRLLPQCRMGVQMLLEAERRAATSPNPHPHLDPHPHLGPHLDPAPHPGPHAGPHPDPDPNPGPDPDPDPDSDPDQAYYEQAIQAFEKGKTPFVERMMYGNTNQRRVDFVKERLIDISWGRKPGEHAHRLCSDFAQTLLRLCREGQRPAARGALPLGCCGPSGLQRRATAAWAPQRRPGASPRRRPRRRFRCV